MTGVPRPPWSHCRPTPGGCPTRGSTRTTPPAAVMIGDRARPPHRGVRHRRATPGRGRATRPTQLRVGRSPWSNDIERTFPSQPLTRNFFALIGGCTGARAVRLNCAHPPSARCIRDALTPHAYGRRHGSSQQATTAGEGQAAGRARRAPRLTDVGGRRPCPRLVRSGTGETETSSRSLVGGGGDAPRPAGVHAGRCRGPRGR